MKILFFSDVHGSVAAVERLLEHARALQPDLLALLGDVLYHGPRNHLPGVYDPAAVAEMLNAHADRIVAVRGNCDAEVDQLLLRFPIMADYLIIQDEKVRFFLTHGHLYIPDRPPALAGVTVFASGHTHVPTLEKRAGVVAFNPGSISLPKGGSAAGFGMYDGSQLELRCLEDGAVLGELPL